MGVINLWWAALFVPLYFYCVWINFTVREERWEHAVCIFEKCVSCWKKQCNLCFCLLLCRNSNCFPLSWSSSSPLPSSFVCLSYCKWQRALDKRANSFSIVQQICWSRATEHFYNTSLYFPPTRLFKVMKWHLLLENNSISLRNYAALWCFLCSNKLSVGLIRLSRRQLNCSPQQSELLCQIWTQQFFF